MGALFKSWPYVRQDFVSTLQLVCTQSKLKLNAHTYVGYYIPLSPIRTILQTILHSHAPSPFLIKNSALR